MKYIHHRGWLSLLFLSCYAVLPAQSLSVANDPPITPENLISNVFLGEGIEVLSITFNGDPAAIGQFQGGASTVGMDRGVVMTTGLAVSRGLLSGVDAGGILDANLPTNSTAYDADLAGIVGLLPLEDVAKYEITFRPTSDTLRFRYAFGSEEYPAFVCSEFNDIFGFFISGPGINGPYAGGAENIALIPGTNLPVRINNVNPGLLPVDSDIRFCSAPLGSLDYSRFYNANEFSNLAPVYNGFTDVFEAVAIVQPCQVYTIKLVLADVGDFAYDSGVFLEAKSFGSASLNVSFADFALDNSLAEGCRPGRVTFTLPYRAKQDYEVGLRWAGAATPASDLAPLPSPVVIPAGDSSVTIILEALADNLPETSEQLLMLVQRDACQQDTFTITLHDDLPRPAALPRDTSLCRGAGALLDARTAISSSQVKTFISTGTLDINQTEQTFTSTIAVSGVEPAVLRSGLLRSVCIDSLDHERLEDLDIFLEAPDGQLVELTTDNGGDGGSHNRYLRTCFSPTATTRIDQAGVGAVPFSGDWLPEGTFSDLWAGADKRSNGSWRLHVTDDKAGDGGRLFRWSLNFNPVYAAAYEWTPSTGLSCTDCPMPVATPADDQRYFLRVTDTYGCERRDTVDVKITDALPPPNLRCASATANSVSFAWEGVAGSTAYEISLDGSNWQAIGNMLGYRIDNLAAQSTADLFVRGVGACVGTVAKLSCATSQCNLPTVTAETRPAGCSGAANGGVVLRTGGPGGTLTFQLGTETNTSGIFDGLPAGNYKAEVTDAAGCSVEVPFTISLANEPKVQLTTLESIRCADQNNGSLQSTISGGQGPYTYQWSNGQTTPTLTNLGPGAYQLTVTDTNGCSAVSTINLTAPPPLSLSVQATPAGCGGGSLRATVTGGLPPYRYEWFTAAGAPVAAGQSADQLPAGGYRLEVTDANQCSSQLSTQITSLGELTVIPSWTPPTCSGRTDGSAGVTVAGGQSPYSYAWSNGADTPGINGLAAGTYRVTVSDNAGCVRELSIAIVEAGPIRIDLQLDSVRCAGELSGGAGVTVTGGQAPYTYRWMNGQTTSGIQQIAAGPVGVTVTDAKGCTMEATGQIPGPPSLVLSFDQAMPACGDTLTSIAARVAGGQAPYQYRWSHGESSATMVLLPAGDYELTVTDAGGCETVGSTTIAPIQILSLDVVINPISCAGGKDGAIELVATGGTAPYQYRWADGFAQSSRQGLRAGQYEVSVTDARGCRQSRRIGMGQPEGLSILTEVTGISCIGANSAAITAEVEGGSPPYRYNWSTGDTLARIEGLGAGDYHLTITDANACQLSLRQVVPDPEPLALSIEMESPSCRDRTDGRIELAAAGGIPPYNVNWNNGFNGLEVNNLRAGEYSFTLTDAGGCDTVMAVTLAAPEDLSVDAVVLSESCFGSRDGSLSVIAAGGTPPYRYQLGNRAPTDSPDFDDLPPGRYPVTVLDDRGCSGRLTDVLVPSAMELSVNLGSDLTLDRGDTLTLTPVVSHQNPIISYEWQWKDVYWVSCDTCATIRLAPLGPQSVAVVVMDANGCSATDEVWIRLARRTDVSVPSAFSPNGDERNDWLTVFGRTGTTVLSFQIFDRWGALLYEAGPFTVNDETAGWTGEFRGRPLPSGVYVWRAEVEYLDGEREQLGGASTLLR